MWSELPVRLKKGEAPRRIFAKPSPPRAELGDLDQRQWEVYGGKRIDPWKQESGFAGIGVTNLWRVGITTMTGSGMGKVEDFRQEYILKARDHDPDERPIVELTWGVPWDGPTGEVPIPAFRITKWMKPADLLSGAKPKIADENAVKPAPAQAPPPERQAKAESKPIQTETLEEMLDDAIPNW